MTNETEMSGHSCHDEQWMTSAVDRAAQKTQTYMEWVEALAEGGLLPNETPTDRQRLLRTHLRHGLNLVGATAQLIESSAVLAQIESAASLPEELAAQVFLPADSDDLGETALLSTDAVIAAFADVLGTPEDPTDVLKAERHEGVEL